MSFDIPSLLARRKRKRPTTLRPIIPTASQALDLSEIYQPALDIWAQAKDSILAGYTVTTDSLTVDSPSDISREIDKAASEFDRLVLSFSVNARRWAVKVEQWHRSQWAGSVLAGTQIDLKALLTSAPVAETVDAFIARNVALVRDVSAQAQSRISDAVFRGYQNRTPVREVAKQIDEAVGLGRQRAVRIASDQSKKISAALDRERQAEAGIDQFKWRHSGKLHPRLDHKARDGIIYAWADPPSELPGELPWCGCRAQAYIPLMDEVAA